MNFTTPIICVRPFQWRNLPISTRISPTAFKAITPIKAIICLLRSSATYLSRSSVSIMFRNNTTPSNAPRIKKTEANAQRLVPLKFSLLPFFHAFWMPFVFLLSAVNKIKSAPTGVGAPKNANPNCRYTKPNKHKESSCTHQVEFAILPFLKMYAKKSTKPPTKM